MQALVQLKQDLEFNDSLGGIIEVLKVSASVQLRQLQSRGRLPEEFLDDLHACFAWLGPSARRHPFLVEREGLPSCVVVITSDEGFAGELNTLLVNAALDARNSSRKDLVVVLGERGASSMEELNVSCVSFPGVTDTTDHVEVARLRDYVVRGYLTGRFGRVLFVYAEFLNVTTQRVVTQRLLPCRAFTEVAKRPAQPLIEPSAEQVIDGLVNLWLTFAIRRIFWQSKLSELSARLMHLEGSDQELSRLNHQLALQYAKQLHALADKSIRELSASRLQIHGERSSEVHSR